MGENDKKVIPTVGIIGGGKVGLHLLELFSDTSIARVAYVVDRETLAPAMVRAHQLGVRTFSDMDEALTTTVDFIFEVTGSSKVVELLKTKLSGTSVELVTHNMAFVIIQAIEQREKISEDRVSTEMLGIESEIKGSLTGIQRLVGDIKEIAAEMVMLALNARIEASRAGQYGRGFTVVAQKMSEAVDSVQAITPEIEKISGNILAVSEKIETSLKNLN